MTKKAKRGGRLLGVGVRVRAGVGVRVGVGVRAGVGVRVGVRRAAAASVPTTVEEGRGATVRGQGRRGWHRPPGGRRRESLVGWVGSLSRRGTGAPG